MRRPRGLALFRRIAPGERGAATIEWLALSAAIMAILASVYVALPAAGLADAISDLLQRAADGSVYQVGQPHPPPARPVLLAPAIDGPPTQIQRIAEMFVVGSAISPVDSASTDSLVFGLKEAGGTAEELATLIEVEGVKVTWVSDQEMSQLTGCEDFCAAVYLPGRDEILLNRDALEGYTREGRVAVLAHELAHAQQARRPTKDGNPPLPDKETVERNRGKTIDKYQSDNEQDNKDSVESASPRELEEAWLDVINREVDKEVEANTIEAEVYRSQLTGWRLWIYDEGWDFLDWGTHYPTTQESQYAQYREYYQEQLDDHDVDTDLPPSYEEFQQKREDLSTVSGNGGGGSW